MRKAKRRKIKATADRPASALPTFKRSGGSAETKQTNRQETAAEAKKRRATDREMVRFFGKQYEATSDPLLAWRVYFDCRSYKLPQPAWVQKYFDRVAVALWKLTKKPPSQNAASAILTAFEMKRPGRSGRGDVFSRWAKRNQVGWLVFDVEFFRVTYGLSTTAAVARCARERGVRERAIWKAMQKRPLFVIDD